RGPSPAGPGRVVLELAPAGGAVMNRPPGRSPRTAVEAAVEAARWAPSVHNTQPWPFAVTGEEISLRADADRRLRVADDEGRGMLVSCGGALLTMRVGRRPA